MRSNTILPLVLAHLTLCAPLPIVLEDDMQAALLASPARHPPAPIGTRPGQLRPELLVGGREEETDQKVFDNQPITPSTTEQPSSVLASPQPIETKWLLALTGPTPVPSSSTSTTSTLVTVSDVMADPEEEAKYVAAMIAELEVSRGVMAPSSSSSSRLEAPPCHYAAYLSREYRDMLVISLFVTFVVVIVLAEMWEKVVESRRSAAASSSQAEGALEKGDAVACRHRKWRIADLRAWRRVSQLLGREGAIRLEEGEAPVQPRGISIQASSYVPVTPETVTPIMTATTTLETIDDKTELLL